MAKAKLARDALPVRLALYFDRGLVMEIANDFQFAGSFRGDLRMLRKVAGPFIRSRAEQLVRFYNAELDRLIAEERKETDDLVNAIARGKSEG